MKEKIKEIIPYILIITAVLIIRGFFYTPIRVVGDSMETTLSDKEIMILDKISPKLNEYKRFDIVVIRHQNSYLIKRIVGLPGEKIKYIDNQLYVNDKKVNDPYINNFATELKEIEIPDNKYFVLGDNRGYSKDSRIIGLIDKREMLGKTSLVIFPIKRIGTVK